MKKVLVSIIMFFFLISTGAEGFAQKKSSKLPVVRSNNELGMAKSPADAYSMQMSIYKKAIGNFDYSVATNAIYNMMALRPDQKNLRDTLVILYYNQGAYPQVTLVGKQILDDHPENYQVLELVAVSKQGLGMLKESLADYEKLYGVSKDLFHLYQIATIQYQLKRFGECELSLNKVLASDQANDKTVGINNPDQTTQQVPIKAAVHNMIGVVAMELNRPDQAKLNFQKAIELFPEFALAQANVTALAKRIEGGANPQSK